MATMVSGPQAMAAAIVRGHSKAPANPHPKKPGHGIEAPEVKPENFCKEPVAGVAYCIRHYLMNPHATERELFRYLDAASRHAPSTEDWQDAMKTAVKTRLREEPVTLLDACLLLRKRDVLEMAEMLVDEGARPTVATFFLLDECERRNCALAKQYDALRDAWRQYPDEANDYAVQKSERSQAKDCPKR